LRLIPNSIIHALDGLAYSEAEPGEETITQYDPH